MSDRSVEFEITNRARQYGYIIWPKRSDTAIREPLPEQERVEVVLNGRSLGERRVDWRYRRISVGPTATRRLGQQESRFAISVVDGCLEVTTS